MSDIVNTKKIVVMKSCMVGKKCDVCGKDIKPTVLPRRYGEPFYDYYEVIMQHNDWGNDSVDSYKHFDACSPDCAYTLWKQYIRDSAGSFNTMCIDVEHISCWTINDTEVSGDAD